MFPESFEQLKSSHHDIILRALFVTRSTMADCTPALCQTEITNDRGGEESAETLPAQPKLSFVVPSGTPSIVIEFCDRVRERPLQLRG